MKTALNQIKEKIENEVKRLDILNQKSFEKYGNGNKYVEGKIYLAEEILKEIEQLLPTEREQIEKAVIYGNRQETYDGTETIGEQYFNQTYNE